jgi:hypothetical protein
MAIQLYCTESSTSSNIAFHIDMLTTHFCQCAGIVHGTLDCGKSNGTTIAMNITSKIDWPQSQGIVNSFRV